MEIILQSTYKIVPKKSFMGWESPETAVKNESGS